MSCVAALHDLRWGGSRAAVIEDLVPGSLWARVAPLLPAHPPRRYRYPRWKRTDDRTSLAGIVFVLKTGIAWNLPTFMWKHPVRSNRPRPNVSMVGTQDSGGAARFGICRR